MKEKLTLRNIIICSAAFIALLIFCLSFAVKAHIEIEGAHYRFFTAVWHIEKVVGVENGHIETTMLPKEYTSLFALPLVGFILALVAGIGAVVIALLIKNEKLSKILILVCAVLMIAGGVFMFFVGESAIRTFTLANGGTLAHVTEMKEVMKELGGKYYTGALGIICGVLSILAGAVMGVFQFLPDKKLAK